MNAHILLAVLLALLPVPAARRRCIVERRARIEHDADAAAARYNVPVEVLLAVGYLETHLSCAPGSGGGWGAPISPRRRGVAGGAMHSAAALAWGIRACATTEGAIAHYRYGLCRTPARHGTGYTPADALRLIERVTSQARRGSTP